MKKIVTEAEGLRRKQFFMGFGPPIRHEKFSGAGLRARHRLNGAQCRYEKTFQNSQAWAFGPPVNYEKLL